MFTRRCEVPRHPLSVPIRPRQRRRQLRHRPDQLVAIRRGDVFQLPRQHRIDRRPLPPRQSPQHVPLIPRDSRSQFHQPDRLRQHRRGILPERGFDDGLKLGRRERKMCRMRGRVVSSMKTSLRSRAAQCSVNVTGGHLWRDRRERSDDQWRCCANVDAEYRIEASTAAKVHQHQSTTDEDHDDGREPVLPPRQGCRRIAAIFVPSECFCDESAEEAPRKCFDTAHCRYVTGDAIKSRNSARRSRRVSGLSRTV